MKFLITSLISIALVFSTIHFWNIDLYGYSLLSFNAFIFTIALYYFILITLNRIFIERSISAFFLMKDQSFFKGVDSNELVGVISNLIFLKESMIFNKSMTRPTDISWTFKSGPQSAYVNKITQKFITAKDRQYKLSYYADMLSEDDLQFLTLIMDMQSRNVTFIELKKRLELIDPSVSSFLSISFSSLIK